MLLPKNGGPRFDCGLDRTQTGGMLYQLTSRAHGIRRRGVTAHIERDNRT